MQRAVRLVEMSHFDTKLDKTGNFKDKISISVHVGSTKLILISPVCVPFGAYLTHFQVKYDI